MVSIKKSTTVTNESMSIDSRLRANLETALFDHKETLDRARTPKTARENIETENRGEALEEIKLLFPDIHLARRSVR